MQVLYVAVVSISLNLSLLVNPVGLYQGGDASILIVEAVIEAVWRSRHLSNTVCAL
jgi:hypothetical protein